MRLLHKLSGRYLVAPLVMAALSGVAGHSVYALEDAEPAASVPAVAAENREAAPVGDAVAPAAEPVDAAAPAPSAAAPAAVAPAPGSAPGATPAAAPSRPAAVGESPWVIGIYPAIHEEVVVAESVKVVSTSEGEAAGPAVALPAYGPGYYPCPPARMSYKDAYEQIPFSRAEYEANPGYRHDAAMELVFGAQRPTTIVKQTMPYFSRYPDFYRVRNAVYPYPTSLPGPIDINTYYHQRWYW